MPLNPADRAILLAQPTTEQDALLNSAKLAEHQSKDQCVLNSQILSNALFVYVDDDGSPRGVTHMIAKTNTSDRFSIVYKEQKNFSIGISVGELILSATLMGYKTGICSAFDADIVENIVGCGRIKLLVGVGIANEGVDRRLHSELLNKDVPLDHRTGEESEHWRFPSFDKTMNVSLNGTPI